MTSAKVKNSKTENIKVRSLFIILFFLFSTLVAAKEHIVESSAGKIIFTTTSNEISQRKFFGADLWFTGKKENGKRSVMSILLNSKDIKLDQNVSDKEFKKHKQQMKKFARERSYTNVNFQPYQFQKINDNLGYHYFVWSYKKDNQEYLEQSYYVECGNQFFIAKATTFKSNIDDQDKFKEIVETTKCIK